MITDKIILFLGSSLARYIFVPLVTIVIGTIIKWFSRNDRFDYSSKSLWFWGPDLITSALILLFVDCSSQFSLMATNEIDPLVLLKAFIAFILCLLYIAIILFLIRKKGWKETKPGVPPELKIACGLVFPNMIGVLALISVYFLMK